MPGLEPGIHVSVAQWFVKGWMAELEDAFGVEDRTALAGRFGTGRLSSRDLVRLLAIARGQRGM